MLDLLGFVGFLLAAAFFLLFAVLLATSRSDGIQTRLLLGSAVVSAVWSASMVLPMLQVTALSQFLFTFEAARFLVWTLFLVSVLKLADARNAPASLIYASIGLPLIIGIVSLLPAGMAATSGSLLITGSIVTALLMLTLVERIYRIAEPSAKSGLGYLALGIGGAFGYDLVLYSSAVMFGEIDAGLWAARGLVNAATVPLLFVASRKNTDWPVNMFVSRQAAYFSVTLFASGIYLLVVGVGGFYVKEFGGNLGTALAAVFLFCAVLALFALLFYEPFRLRVRVFLAKHFFTNRYDYREEWRQLSSILYDDEHNLPLGERCIEAVARIMSSQSGYLLLRREGGGAPLVPYAAWQRDLPDGAAVESGDPLALFLSQTGWIIDSSQLSDSPAMYDNLVLPGWIADGDGQKILVPLLNGGQLDGVVVLAQATPVSLNFETTDLLKIIGRQIAGLLAQQMDAERVAEGRQFQAYSRLTAFLMHDLKNVAAQQSLVVKNAVVHKRNPEFVDDAFATIEHSVNRMNRLIAQLAERNRKTQRQSVGIHKLLLKVINETSDRSPVPVFEGALADQRVDADPDKLAAIFVHLIRNAQDASGDEDEIRVVAAANAAEVTVTVSDSGSGMDETFIREQLFKPFESTKGVDGMGIGAYQAREYVRELAGTLKVRSESGTGTDMIVTLPTSIGDVGQQD